MSPSPLSASLPLTHLSSYGSRAAVLEANEGQLALLTGEPVEYVATDGGTLPESNLRTKLLAELLAEPTVTLKVGAPVMLVKTISIEDGLVNGTLGVVVAFADCRELDPAEEATFVFSHPPSKRPKRGRWPVVTFHPLERDAVTAMVFSHDFTVESLDSVVLVRRNQVGLAVSLCACLAFVRPRIFPPRSRRSHWHWHGLGRYTSLRVRLCLVSGWTFATSLPPASVPVLLPFFRQADVLPLLRSGLCGPFQGTVHGRVASLSFRPWSGECLSSFLRPRPFFPLTSLPFRCVWTRWSVTGVTAWHLPATPLFASNASSKSLPWPRPVS